MTTLKIQKAAVLAKPRETCQQNLETFVAMPIGPGQKDHASMFQAPLFGGAVAPKQRPQSATGIRQAPAFSNVALYDELDEEGNSMIERQMQRPRPNSAVARPGYTRGPGGLPFGSGKYPGGASSKREQARMSIHVLPGSLVTMKAKSKYAGRWGYVCRVYDETPEQHIIVRLYPQETESSSRGGSNRGSRRPSDRPENPADDGAVVVPPGDVQETSPPLPDGAGVSLIACDDPVVRGARVYRIDREGDGRTERAVGTVVTEPVATAVRARDGTGCDGVVMVRWDSAGTKPPESVLCCRLRVRKEGVVDGVRMHVTQPDTRQRMSHSTSKTRPAPLPRLLYTIAWDAGGKSEHEPWDVEPLDVWAAQMHLADDGRDKAKRNWGLALQAARAPVRMAIAARNSKHSSMGWNDVIGIERGGLSRQSAVPRLAMMDRPNRGIGDADADGDDDRITASDTRRGHDDGGSHPSSGHRSIGKGYNVTSGSPGRGIVGSRSLSAYSHHARDKSLGAKVSNADAKSKPLFGNHWGEDDLFAAIATQSMKRVGAALDNGADPNVMSSEGVPAIVDASCRGCADVVRLLIRAKADPSVVTRGDGRGPNRSRGDRDGGPFAGMTAMDVAAAKGHDACVAALLSFQVDPNSVVATSTKRKDNVTHSGAEKKPNEWQRDLANRQVYGASDGRGGGARPFYDDDEMDRRGVGPRGGGDRRVAWDPAVKSRPASQPRATGDDHPPRQVLLGAGALHYAASGGHSKVIETLVRGGADHTIGDATGAPPLHLAATAGHVDAMSALARAVTNRAKGSVAADRARREAWSVRNPNTGATAMHAVAATGQSRALAALLAAGADPCAEDAVGDTALHVACRNGFYSICGALLRSQSRGPIISAFNHNGDTPLHVAAAEGSVACIDQLVDAGANLNTRNRRDGGTPYVAASKRGATEAMDRLQKAGASTQMTTASGATALDVALKQGDVGALQQIMASGAVSSLGIAAGVRRSAGFNPAHTLKSWYAPPAEGSVARGPGGKNRDATNGVSAAVGVGVGTGGCGKLSSQYT